MSSRNKVFNRMLKIVCLIIVTAIIVGLKLKPSSAWNQDLGRHLKLGQMIWETRTVPKTNLFTYTQPDFPFINHHWLSEVIFYILYSLWGIFSLTLLKLTLIGTGFLWVFLTAESVGGLIPALIASTITLPLMSARVDERPEIFGYFFFPLFMFILFSGKKFPKGVYLLTPLCLFLWVNLHLSFIYGVLLLTLFTFQKVIPVISRIKGVKFRSDVLFYACLYGVNLFVLFFNPNGLQGALYPLKIFGNYGYRIIENQSVTFLWDKIHDPNLLYFSVIAAIVTGITLLAVIRKKFSFLFFITWLFTGLGFWAIRNFPFFTLAAIPAMSFGIQALFPEKIRPRLTRDFGMKFLSSVSTIILTLTLFLFLMIGQPVSTEVPELYKPAADFFLEHKIPGNIFNNFDNGGYLDYRLYPQYKLFVDNRPEAFPKEFFDEYIKIQEDPLFRKEEFKKYNINSVFFAHTDITPWAQTFLQQIVEDKEWRIAYLDGISIILVKK